MRLLALLLALLPLPALAQDVELELVLLADASGSIDQAEIEFQRAGYATAITDSRVIDAITLTAYGKIAVTYVEWGDFRSQAVVVPWTIIDGPETAERFARDLMLPPRMAFGRNAIGAALLKGKELIETNDIDGWRKVIDFSGDSAGNFNGPSIAEGREAVVTAGITINGLPIFCRHCSGPTQSALDQVYRERIIGGPGAFVVPVESRDGFADAVRRKLILEIGGLTPETQFAASR